MVGKPLSQCRCLQSSLRELNLGVDFDKINDKLGLCYRTNCATQMTFRLESRDSLVHIGMIALERVEMCVPLEHSFFFLVPFCLHEFHDFAFIPHPQ